MFGFHVISHNIIHLHTSTGAVVGLKSVIYSVDEENDGEVELCVELLSQKMPIAPAEITLSTYDGTASGMNRYILVS